MMDIFTPPLVTNEITQTSCNVPSESSRPACWSRHLVGRSLWEEWPLWLCVGTHGGKPAVIEGAHRVPADTLLAEATRTDGMLKG